MLRRPRRKLVAVAVAVVGSLAIATAGLAYFTSTGSGTGSAVVGNTTGWTVNIGSGIGGPLYPGAGAENISYTVTNSSPGVQALGATSASVASSTLGGDVTQNGVPVPGCSASWFTATNNPPSPQAVLGGQDSTAGSVDVTMQDSGTNQDACQGATPDITISAS
jgi:hypothetical protein